MEDITITTLKTYKRLMKIAAIWPKKRSNIFYDLYRYFNALIITTVGILIFADIYVNFSTMEHFIYGVCSGMAVLQSVQKLTSFFAKKHEFKKIIYLLKTAPLTVDEKHLKIYLHKNIIISNRFRNVYLGSCFITLFAGFVTPLLLKEKSRPLPMPFPFDVNKQPISFYYTAFVAQVVASVLTVWCTCWIDSFIFTLIWIAVGHCEILNHKITFASAAVAQEINNNTVKNKNYLLREYLKGCAFYHAQIHRIVKLIEESSALIFFGLLQALIPICLMGLSLVVVPVSSTQFGRYVLLLCCSLLQMTLFCIPGDELILQSRKVGDACYSFQWENYDVQVRQIIFLMMERAKRPFYLTTAKLMTLSVASLMSFIKASVSYFTVFRHMYQDRNM